jgi:hypothetical protein
MRKKDNPVSLPVEAPARCSTYERIKRYRSRLRSGSVFAHVEINQSLAETLIDSGFMLDSDCQSPRKVGEAFMRYIRQPTEKKT